MVTIVADGRFGAGGEIDEQPTVYSSAQLSSGGFVLISGARESQGVINATIFDAEGKLVGPPVQITAHGSVADVVGLSSGGFAVAWIEASSPYPKTETQIFDETGQPVAPVTILNTLTDSAQLDTFPALTALANGSYVVSWLSGDLVFRHEVRVQLVDGGGTPISDVAKITPSSGAVFWGDAATLADGRVAIGYSTSEYNSRLYTASVALYDPFSAHIIDEDFVSIAIPSGYSVLRTGVTALSTGNILVTWETYNNGSTQYATNGRIYDLSGNALSQGFTIPSSGLYTTTALDDGGFAIAYIGGTAQNGRAIGQVYDANGTPAGAAFSISDPNEAATSVPTITAFGSYDLAAAWNYIPASGNIDASLRLYFSAIVGTAAGERLSGSEGADFISGAGGADVLVGLAGDDSLSGGADADFLDGGAGNDTAVYDDSDTGVVVNLATGLGAGGSAQGDTLVSIENLIGSAFNDVLTGNAAPNRIEGGTGDDVLIGGAGADALDGGVGTDTADYSASAAGVTVNLAIGTGAGGDAAGDTLMSIEHLRGSAFADSLTGNGGANRLEGLDGDDILSGGVNADILDGGSGTDTASYEASANDSAR